MSKSIDINNTNRARPRNTFKASAIERQSSRRSVEEEDYYSSGELFFKALRVIFRWKSLVILLGYVLKKSGVKLPQSNSLSRFQNNLYEKLESFFGQ